MPRAPDYFGLTRPSSIEYAASLERTRFVAISVDDWILPKAGAVGVWKRRPSDQGRPPAEPAVEVPGA